MCPRFRIILLVLVIASCDHSTATSNESQSADVALSFSVESTWGPWSPPVNVTAINSSANDNFPVLASDQLSLYFASPRPGGLGGNDIWVSRRASRESPWEQPVNLGAPVNSSANDQGPNLSRDGLLLFFHSNRPGGHGEQDIYVAHRARARDDLGWADPVNLGGGVNTTAFEAGAMFSQQVAEGRTNLYFFRGITSDDGDIFSAAIKRNGETLGPAVPVSELNVAGVSDARPTVRADGKELFFFSTRSGGLGLADLYVSTRRDTRSPWSTPVNVGPPINTSFTDIQPSLATDAETLLFSSNRPGGLGNNDIWMSTRARHPN